MMTKGLNTGNNTNLAPKENTHAPVQKGIRRVKGRSLMLSTGLTFLMSACTNTGLEHKTSGGVRPLGELTKSGRKSKKALYSDLAHHFSRQGNYAMAIPMFRQAIRSEGRSTTLFNGLGKSLVAVGQYNEAIKTYKASLGKDGRNPTALLGLGNSYLAFGELPLAESFFRSSLVAGYRGTAPHAGLAVALDANGRHDEALSVIEDGLAQYANDIDLLNNKALSLALHDDAKGAIRILERLVRRKNSSIEMRQNLALAYTLNGQPKKALTMAAIDYDTEMAAEAVSNFSLIQGLDPATRTRAIIYGMINEREDAEQAANFEVTGDEKTKLETARRITPAEPEPIPVPKMKPLPKPEPKPIMLPKPEPEIELPPLIEPEGWAVQIAAYRHAREVMPGWRLLYAKFFTIIGHLEPRRSEVDFGDGDGKGPIGGFYRLNAGPLKNFRLAFEVCQELLAAGGECWIRPPEPTEGKLPLKKDDAAKDGNEANAPKDNGDKSAEDLRDIDEVEGVRLVKESGEGLLPEGYERR